MTQDQAVSGAARRRHFENHHVAIIAEERIRTDVLISGSTDNALHVRTRPDHIPLGDIADEHFGTNRSVGGRGRNVSTDESHVRSQRSYRGLKILSRIKASPRNCTGRNKNV